MTCAKCGRKNLERDATGAYRCCGVETRLVDPGMPPRGRVVDPFKPLPEEQGWSQADAEAWGAAVPKRELRAAFDEKLCRDCDQPFKPNNSVQVRCTACAVATRKTKGTGRYASRPTVTLFTAKLRRAS